MKLIKRLPCVLAYRKTTHDISSNLAYRINATIQTAVAIQFAFFLACIYMLLSNATQSDKIKKCKKYTPKKLMR